MRYTQSSKKKRYVKPEVKVPTQGSAVVKFFT